MRSELDSLLCTLHPAIFANRQDGRSLIGHGIDGCDCWFDLLDSLCTDLQAATRDGDPQVVVEQIKSKFGELRFYCSGPLSERQERMIAHAVARSRDVCAGHCGRAKRR